MILTKIDPLVNESIVLMMTPVILVLARLKTVGLDLIVGNCIVWRLELEGQETGSLRSVMLACLPF